MTAPPGRRSGPDAQPEPPATTPGPDQEAGVGTSLARGGGDDLELLAAEFASGYRLGYECGFEHGWRRGYDDCDGEYERAWHVAAERVRATLRAPTFAELQRRRGEAS